jgi:hypothetical protein
MTRATTQSVRVQVYLSDPKLAQALVREARQSGVALSQAAGRAIARGLARTPTADPEDRLALLERALREHMRASARDMTFVLELTLEFARAFFLRLPDVAADEDPLLRAAVEQRIEGMLDAIAARIVAGGSKAIAPGGRTGL